MKARNRYTGEICDLSDNMDQRIWELIPKEPTNPNPLTLQAFQYFIDLREAAFDVMTELHNSIMFAMGRRTV